MDTFKCYFLYGGVLVPQWKKKNKSYVGLIRSYVGGHMSYIGLEIISPTQDLLLCPTWEIIIPT